MRVIITIGLEPTTVPDDVAVNNYSQLLMVPVSQAAGPIQCCKLQSWLQESM